MVWRRLGLTQRLLVPMAFIILLGGAVQSYFEVRSGSAEARLRLAQEAHQLLETLAPVVAENVLVGDYATLKELLDRQVQTQDEVKRLVWRTPNGGEFAVHGEPTLSLAPAWFHSWANIPTLEETRQVTLGGTLYGFLTIQLTPMLAENRLWARVMQSTVIVAMTMLATLALTWLLLRANLTAVQRIAEGADRLRAGDLDVRLHPRGAPELRTATDAFNRLAEQLQSSLRDLAENRHRLDEQLHFTQELIRVLPNPVFYTDADGRFIGVNAAWEKLFGLARASVVGKGLGALGLRDGQTMAALAAHDAELLAMPGMQVYEAIHKGSDGIERHLMYAKATFTRADGTPAGLIGVITDLTATKRAEEEARDALIDKVRAESANEAKSAFLANMSHEIRTPLTAVIGFGESLLEPDTTMQERIDAIHTIIRAGKHLQHLINDILDLSKIEAGRMATESLSIPIISLIDDVAAFAGPQAEAKGVEFRVEYQPPLPEEIHTDPLRLKQILLNLVGNAVKFTQEGRVALRVSCDVERQKLTLQVIDTGVGLSEEQIGRLFRPFEQAASDTTRKFGGTGLGLHLSKRFAQLLGGDISVHSEPGRGSCFTVTVSTGDLSEASFLKDLTSRSRQDLSAKGLARLRLEGRVLLAEDNADNQRLIGFHLRRLGIEPLIAPDGQAAVGHATAEPFDLILMDMQMPIMDGLEATRRLRAQGYGGPIVALTANAMQQDGERCREAGCDAFLTKPIDREQFVTTLGRYLRASDPQASTRRDDTPIASALLETDPELSDLVERFLAQLPSTVATIERLVAQQDWDGLRAKLHDLKAVGGGYGFPQLSAAASRMHFALTAGDTAAVANLVGEIQHLRERILSGGAQSKAALQRAAEELVWP